MEEGKGMMWCLAGVGAGIEMIVDKARSADLNLILDGCPMDCAWQILRNAGAPNVRRLRVTDLGIDKEKGVRAAEVQVAMVVDRALEMLRE
jgi:uncharacterized metal-binding protein